MLARLKKQHKDADSFEKIAVFYLSSIVFLTFLHFFRNLHKSNFYSRYKCISHLIPRSKKYLRTRSSVKFFIFYRSYF